MHQSSLDDMKWFVETHLKSRRGAPLLIFDLGSRAFGPTYKQFFTDEKWVYTGVDVEEGENVDLALKDPYRWDEVEDGSVDVVISGQAFEHIEFFWVTMRQIAKALKPGGLCCIIAPSGGYEHRYPVDCWRFYQDGMRALANYAGLEVIEARTQWEPKGYPDNSDQWANSVLVARKPADATGSWLFDEEESPGPSENYLRSLIAMKDNEIIWLRGELEKVKHMLFASERPPCFLQRAGLLFSGLIRRLTR